MLNWNNYLIELELEKLYSLSEVTNEGFDSFMNKLDAFLAKEVEVPNFEEIVINLLKKFKNKIKFLIIIGTLLLSYFSITKIHDLMSQADIQHPIAKEVVSKIKVNKHKTHKSNIVNSVETKAKKAKNEIGKFLKKLAERESTSNPKAINDLGYIGKYQFGQMALQDLDLDDKINAHKFKKNPAIFPEKMQDMAMIKLLKLNKGYLGDYVDRYVGKKIAGVDITKSGLLAGSHLVGAGAVKQFLDSNGKFVPKDGNGVPVTEYIKKFGGFNLTF